MMPFSSGIRHWLKKHPDFFAALKIIYPKRFIALLAIVISYSKLVPKDKIIGIFAYDYLSRPERFKQDFIVDINNKDQEFILYTRLPNRNYGKYVKDINEFFNKYSKGIYYKDSHHISFQDIPEELKPRAIEAQKLGKKLKLSGLRNLSQKEMENLELKLCDL
ncbi:hypothetical protein A2X44_04490 [candidate division CPR3 bacterium GWF2_35_18]|nr:MAG: hypothetical protein A2X44_04490 [candidate division CPR3 bacterium GWF2_35_18]